MKQVITIRGKPVIEIFESFDGSYWFVIEKAWKQDSLINGKVYKNDQIFFGYVRLSHCPELAEFGYFSEAELKSLGWMVWKVDRINWPFCPEVEVEEVPEQEPADGKRRPIFIYGAYSGGHCPAAERTEGHTRKFSPVYARNYQPANKAAYYWHNKRKLPGIYRRPWSESDKPRYIIPKLKVLEPYSRQTVGISYGHKLALYKSLDAYFS
jgi:hypothetical protein